MRSSLAHLGVVIAVLLLFASCGGSASAPPVDLPAPITGRIDISEPDADGNLSIAGEAGAVDGDAMVMAVNETVAGTQSRLWDLLVPSAFAQSAFPPVCSEAGHQCTIASADGAFVIAIAATDDDPIVIGVISPIDGRFISGLLRRGANSRGNCASLGLSGKAVDVGIIPNEGTPLLLFEGSEDATNRIVIGEKNQKTVYLPGCYAKDLAIKSLEGTTAVAVVSADDRILWRGFYTNGLFSKMRHFVLNDAPASVAFGRSPLVAILASQSFANASFSRVSLVDGSIIPPAGPSIPAQLDPATLACQRLDAIEMDSGDPLGIAIVNRGMGTPASLLFLDIPRMRIVGLWTAATWSGVVRVLHDCTIHATGAGVLYITCSGRNAPDGEFVELDVLGVGAAGAISPLTTSALLENLSSIQLFDSTVFGSLPFASQSVTASAAVSNGAVLASSSAGDLILFNPRGGTVSDVLPIAPGDDIVAIALDEASRSFFAADATTGGVVSLGAQLNWTN